MTAHRPRGSQTFGKPRVSVLTGTIRPVRGLERDYGVVGAVNTGSD